MMKLSNLYDYLDVIYSNEEVELGKPSPEMYIAAMNDSVKPKETLILEDNDHGIQAAIASGAHLMKIGVPSDVTYTSIRERIIEIETGV